jgi:DNA invertase Pin-like site-specific DNA recombinase
MRVPKCHCGWKFPGFHICVDLSRPCPGEFQMKKPKGRYRSEGAATAYEKNLEEGRKRREQREAAAIVRDKAIIERYKENVSYKQLCEEFNISHATVAKAVKQAAERGEITPRPKGRKISYYAMGGV